MRLQVFNTVVSTLALLVVTTGFGSMLYVYTEYGDDAVLLVGNVTSTTAKASSAIDGIGTKVDEAVAAAGRCVGMADGFDAFVEDMQATKQHVEDIKNDISELKAIFAPG